MTDTQEVPTLAPVVPNQEAPVVKKYENTFKFGDFEFPHFEVNEHGMITGGSLLQLLMTALAASDDKNIKSFLQAAQIEVKDVNGKRFFPQAGD